MFRCLRVSLSELQLENEELKKQLAECRAVIADRDATIAKLARDLADLQALVKRMLAGRRNGHVVPECQGLLFPDAAATSIGAGAEAAPAETPAATVVDANEADDATPTRTRRQRTGKPCKIDTTGLQVEEIVREVPPEKRVCPKTGQAMVKIGEKVFDEIDYQRARLGVRRYRQAVYGLPPEAAKERKAPLLLAEMPPRPLENCVASSMLLAWLLVQKFANHLPLYRQEAIFGRDGLRLPRQTLCDWVLAAAGALRPIADCLMGKIRTGPVMQLDDTPVMCQGGKGQPNFQAYLWTFVNPEVHGVAYRFTVGRASDLLAAELGDFTGFLLGDGYSGNRAAADKVRGKIVHAGCWAHVTRKLRDAAAEAPATAALLRADIKAPYAIEHEADAAGLDPDARRVLRQQKARPVLAALFGRVRRLRKDFSDAGSMAKALTYIRNQRQALRRFLDDGRLSLDNNACERAIRPIAIGRRNWLFAGSVRGGQAAAVVYTLIESCRRANVDPVNYFADVLVRVATHPASQVDQLLPNNWAATVREQIAEPALR